MTTSEIIKMFENLIEKKAVLLSPYGSHWTPEIHYADGNACVIFTNVCMDTVESEFLHYIGVDTLKITDKQVFMTGTDGEGSDDTLDGQFYIPYSI
jgi:hypothetical protein